MTSITKVRSWEVAVSRIRLMASTTVLTAVSKPMRRSVPGTSLSMVAGMPQTGSPCAVQGQGPGQGSVAADHHQAVDPGPLQLPERFLPALGFQEPVGPGRSQDGAAAVDDVAHVSRSQGYEVAADQTLETVAHPEHLRASRTAPRRTTARMAAFMPGASPPDVRTAMRKPAPPRHPVRR